MQAADDSKKALDEVIIAHERPWKNVPKKAGLGGGTIGGLVGGLLGGPPGLLLGSAAGGFVCWGIGKLG